MHFKFLYLEHFSLTRAISVIIPNADAEISVCGIKSMFVKQNTTIYPSKVISMKVISFNQWKMIIVTELKLNQVVQIKIVHWLCGKKHHYSTDTNELFAHRTKKPINIS